MSLTLHNVSAQLGGVPVLNRLSLDLPEGEILAIVGPSGCGKSTLLNILAGINTTYTGEIRYREQPIAQLSKGYVPQSLGLLPWKRVKENIFIGTAISPALTIEQAEAESIIRELGVEPLLNRYPSELSGGQQQRVALARLFVTCSDLLLMDEPFSALDSMTADITRNLFLSIWKKRKITTVLTTHNLQEAVALGKHILIMSSMPATVAHFIENPIWQKGADRSVANQLAFEAHLKELLHTTHALQPNTYE